MTDHEPTLAEVLEESPKRRRGRPPKTVTVGIDGESDAEQKPTRRARKLTADDVTQMTCGGFDLIAMVRGPHWKVAPSEVEEWAKNAADVLNRIPSRYAKGMILANGYAMVAYGLYKIVQPRIEADQIIRATMNAVNNGTVTPEEANATLNEEFARWPGPKAGNGAD